VKLSKVLKAPFPYFGGKSSVASLVWDRLGDVGNYIEPFCGSAAMLLRRPHPPRIETLNDADCFVANFWRATQHDPEAVAEYADGPVNEADLHSRHRWLVGVPSSPWTDTPYLHAMAGEDRLETDRREFRRRMRQDPDHYCTRTAGWWCWGLCCWIGSGWCQEPWQVLNGPLGGSGLRRPAGPTGCQGVHANCPAGGSGERGPMVSGGQQGHGVHAQGALHEKRQRLTAAGLGQGVHANGPTPPGSARGPDDTHRPQLADAYSLGRGVHAGARLSQQIPYMHANQAGFVGMGVNQERREIGTCAQRRQWLLDWFGRLRDRLRCVRVCCGDWSRVCSSESVTTRLGVTGVFLDPPYGAKANRDSKIYSVDSLTVADDVQAWCLANGDNRQMRIALCGYAGEGHEALEAAGWDCVAWKAAGGYGNRSAHGKENAARERIWFSPNCKNQKTLFDELETA